MTTSVYPDLSLNAGNPVKTAILAVVRYRRHFGEARPDQSSMPLNVSDLCCQQQHGFIQ